MHITRCRFKIHDAALGIELRDIASTWFWRFITPAPPSTWHGPYDNEFEAHAVAVRSLLWLAAMSRHTLDDMLEDDEADSEQPLPDAWTCAFEEQD